ncbi:MAG TPA: M48 family metalloprotease [Chryseolinea sp.]|nr:M48 family metalloprotease [Chryseolinea sp.]
MCRQGIISLFFLLSYAVSNAQLKTSYTARGSYIAFTKEFTATYKDQTAQEFPDSLYIPNRHLVKRINAKRHAFLVSEVQKGAYVKDDSLENFVNSVLLNLVEATPSLDNHYRKIFIKRSLQANASCYGRGLFMANIGLIGRIENEDQLAFVVAHEMAHDELGHIRERILLEASTNLSLKTKEQLKKIMAGEIEPEEIEELRNLIYGVTKHSRENELKADSMAIVLINNAGYDVDEAISALSMIEYSLKPKRPIDVDLFLPFDAIEYPFKIEWLDEQLSLYNKDRSEISFIGLKDSVDTHPEIEFRIQELHLKKNASHKSVQYQDSEFANSCIELAEFETVETAYLQKKYDWSLFYAMQLLNRYPKNAYLISRIGKIFSTLYTSKNSGTFNFYVSRYTGYYSNELRWVSNFLKNLTKKELGDVAFYFLSNPNNFNEMNKSHYYNLIEICELTERDDVKKRTEQTFKKVFGKSIGNYTFE